MAVTYVGAGAVTSAGATSISPAMPAGIAANDILLAVLHSNDNNAVTVPTGWAVVGAVNAGTGSRTTVAWKRAAGGDTAQAFTKTGTVAFIGRVIAFRGVRTTGNPYTVTPTTTSKTTASTSFSLTGITGPSSSSIRGVNSSGGEFGTSPGTYGTDYHYDGLSSLQYLYGRGHRTVRLPFLWERIQPTLGAALDAAELGRLNAFVANAGTAGLGVILDVHNYGAYNGNKLTAAGGPTQAQFVDLWTRLSTAFKADARVIGYGLMNEPNGLPSPPLDQTNRVSTNFANWFADDGAPTILATTFSGRSALKVTRTTAPFNGASATANVTVTAGEKLTMAADVWPATASGRSRVRLEWRDAGNNILSSTSSPNNSIPTGAWYHHEMNVTVPASATQAKFSVFMDDQNTAGDNFYISVPYVASVSPSIWVRASQAAVTAIRANIDTKLILVPGDNWSGVADWTLNNGSAGWITDSASNFLYEGHHYWDRDHSGAYANTYSAEVTDSTAIGWTAGAYPDALSNRVLTEFANWRTWLASAGVGGFVGEMGWPRNNGSHTGDYTSWNALGERWYAAADTAGIAVTYWSASEWWGTYSLSLYDTTASVLAVPNSQAATVEAHLAPTTTNNMIVACVGALVDAASTTVFSGWTSTGVGAMTEVVDNATSTLNGGAVGAAYGSIATAAATGNITGTMTSAVNGGVVVALVPQPTALAKVNTLTDNFATADTAKWSGYGANVFVTSGQLQINCTSSYFNVLSVNQYDLTDSILTVEVLQVPNVGTGTTSAAMWAQVDANNSVTILWEGGVLYSRYIVAGVSTLVSTAYNSTAHKIWRIRESGGILYFEASATGTSWSSLRTPISTPFNVSAVSVILQSGYYGTEATPGSALFDNLNATYSEPPPAPRTLYVDPAGSDSNDGLSTGAAWATLSKVTSTLLYPGDRVLFKRGGTWTGNLTVASSGASGNPLTIGAYGTGAAPIVSGGGSSGVAGTYRPCEVYGSFVVLDGLEFRGGSIPDADVYFNGPDCTIQNCTIRWGSYGIMQAAGATRLKILHNTMVDVNVGIIGAGSNDDTGANSVVLFGDAAEVAYNTSSGSYFTSPDYGFDGSFVDVYGATNAVVHHNTASQSIAFAELGNPASSNNLYYDNLFTSTLTGAGGFVVHGALYDDLTTDPFGPVLGTKVYHNTIVLTSGDAASIGVWLSPNGQLDLQNNVIVVTGSAKMASIGTSTSTVTEAGNVFWNISLGAAGSISILGSSAVAASSRKADPLFVSSTDLRLQPGSPAIDRGVTNFGYATDLAGNPRVTGAAPDAGAYEGAVTVTTTAAAPIAVQVDWSRNGSFADIGDDVSDRTRGQVVCAYGRDGSTALSTVTAGRGSFDLDNTSRDYSPRNTASSLFGNVKPARPVQITRTVSGTTYTIFRGHTDDQPLNPDVESRLVTANLVDYLQDLRGITISTTLYQGIRTGAAIGAVLTAAGWTGGRDIDAGATVIPYWWEDGTDAFDALQKILASEGPPALLTVGSAGEIVFRDRHHRIIRSASYTPQATFRGLDTSPEPVMARGYAYNDAWGNVVNSPTINVGERHPAEVAAVWQSDDIINIPASQSYVVVLQASDPFLNPIVPIVKVSEDTEGDYTILAGGIASVSLSRTSGQSTSITFTATGAGATISGVQLRAQPLVVARTYQVGASAAARSTANTAQSVLDYGQRGIPSGLEPVWAGRYDAQAIADLYVLQRAQSLTILSVRFIAGDLQPSRLTAILGLDLSDRVTVVEAESQVADDFYVESISHVIDGAVSHEVVFGLEEVPSQPSGVMFVVGSSPLNGTDVLGY